MYDFFHFMYNEAAEMWCLDPKTGGNSVPNRPVSLCEALLSSTCYLY